jgi:hypothetical protein
MLTADQEWENFLVTNELKPKIKENIETNNFIPKVSPLYISTQTKICYLNQPINLENIFWHLPVMAYQMQKNGIVKKQMKISCETKEESSKLNEKIKKEKMIIIDNIKYVDEPNRRIKYKDIKKINVGLCKKDLTRYRTKRKGAFYNCFVLMIRLKEGDIFKEVHIKVFNTGKLEIPGIKTDKLLIMALDNLVKLLEPYCTTPLSYNKTNIDTVLINSNFTCNYYINRNKLYHILKYKYKLHVNFDPCSYPGIQVKYYYNKTNLSTGVCACANRCTKKGKGSGENNCLEISFMVFRTGSALIVGHCDKVILNIVYGFLGDILKEEYNNIYICNNVEKKKPVKKKKRKKIIVMDSSSN